MDQLRSDRRKSLVVDRPAQARLVFGLTALPLTVLVVAALVMWYLSIRLFEEAQVVEADLPSLAILTLAQFVFVAATGTLLVVRAFHYSHRVAGPAHRIAEALRRAREGDRDLPLKLRQGDELGEIAEELSRFLAELARQDAMTEPPAEARAEEPAHDEVCRNAD